MINQFIFEIVLFLCKEGSAEFKIEVELNRKGHDMTAIIEKAHCNL